MCTHITQSTLQKPPMAPLYESSLKCSTKGKRDEEKVAPKRGRTPRRSHGSAIPVLTGGETEGVRKSRSVDSSRRSQVSWFVRSVLDLRRAVLSS